jgi:hypothetical protein
MKQPEIKTALIATLKVGMDTPLEAQGYRRSPKGLVYSHTGDGASCHFAVEFASNPSYAPGCLAHLKPALRIANQSISERALQLVEDPLLLANAPEVIQNRRLTMLTEPQMPEWYVAEAEQLPSAIDEILEVFFDLGLPFLRDYSTSSGIIRQHEAGDTRPLRQQHYYVYVIAAYLLEGRPDAALALLHKRFTKPGIKRRFQCLWTNMNAEQGSVP